MHKLSVLAFFNIFSLSIKLKLDPNTLENFPYKLHCNLNNIGNLLKFVDAGQYVVTSSSLRKLKWTPSGIISVLEGEGMMNRKTVLIPAEDCIQDSKCRDIIENLLVNNEPIPWNFYKDKQSLYLRCFSENSRVPLLEYVLYNHFNEIRRWSYLSCAFLTSGRWDLWNYAIIENRFSLHSIDLNPLLHCLDDVRNPEFFLMVTAILHIRHNRYEQHERLAQIVNDSNKFSRELKTALESVFPFDKKEISELRTRYHNLGEDSTNEERSIIQAQITNAIVQSLHRLFDISQDFLVRSSILMITMQTQTASSRGDTASLIPFTESMKKLNGLDFDSVSLHPPNLPSKLFKSFA